MSDIVARTRGTVDPSNTMRRSVSLLDELLPKGKEPMFQSLRDAGILDAPRAINVRWINIADDGTIVLNIWRDDITPIKGQLIATIRPQYWNVKGARRRSKRDEVVEMLSANAGALIRVVVLERSPRNMSKHYGTRFDCDARWLIRDTGRGFRLCRAQPGEAGDDSPPKTPAEFGKLKPTRREVVSRQIERSAHVKAATLKRAKHRCEIASCQDYLHYESMDVHHVTALGKRGADHTLNTVALCPACHTRVHRGKIRIREPLEGKLRKLLRNRR